MIVPTAQRESFRAEGYCTLPAALPGIVLAQLRDECDAMMAALDAEMEKAGTSVLGPNRRGRQYFEGSRSLVQPGLNEFLFSDFMAEVCLALLGPDSYLFWEQFAVKLGEAAAGDRERGDFRVDDGPSSLGLLSWHQDSGYVPFDHDPYLTVWVALDDVCEDSGPVRVIPCSELGIRTRVTHIPAADNGDLVGYFGRSRGVPGLVPACCVSAAPPSTQATVTGRSALDGRISPSTRQCR
jgi:hypothetical protein